MNKLMQYKGFLGSAEVSLEDGVLYGKIEYISDLVTYEAVTISELKTAFHVAVDDYLDTCEMIGKVPDSVTYDENLGETKLGEQFKRVSK